MGHPPLGERPTVVAHLKLLPRNEERRNEISYLAAEDLLAETMSRGHALQAAQELATGHASAQPARLSPRRPAIRCSHWRVAGNAGQQHE